MEIKEPLEDLRQTNIGNVTITCLGQLTRTKTSNVTEPCLAQISRTRNGNMKQNPRRIWKATAQRWSFLCEEIRKSMRKYEEV